MVERKRRLVSGACICPLVELGELLPNTFFWPRVNWSSFFFFFPSGFTSYLLWRWIRLKGSNLKKKQLKEDVFWERASVPDSQETGRAAEDDAPRRTGVWVCSTKLLQGQDPPGCMPGYQAMPAVWTKQSGCLPLYLALSQTGRKKIPANLQGVPDCSPLQLQNWSLRVLRGIPIFAFYTREGLKYLFSSWLVCNTNGEPVNLPHWPHPEKDLKTDTLNAHILGWSGSTLWQQTHQSTAEVGQILALLQKPPWILHAETSQNEDTQHSKK